MRANVPHPKSTSGSLRHRISTAVLGSLLFVGSLGCAGAGQYVWYRELPPSEQNAMAGDYVIGVGDSISIRVYEQDGVSSDVKVRTDGKIALPFAGELVAAGK